MDTKKTAISIWRDALGYAYSDDYDTKTQLTMIDSFAMLIARLATMLQYSEDFDEIVMFKIEITKDVYND